MKKITALAVAVALATVACAKRPVPLGPRVPAAETNTDSLDRLRADSIARADSLRRAEAARLAAQDSMRAERDREQRDAAALADADRILAATVYFDYDQSTLTDAARALLTAKIPVLQSRTTTRIRITGHTDNRGSAEYNLALGLRRAAETKAFMVAKGIDAGRIDIFSMGAERPAVEGSGEDVWSKNRRAEFQVLTGGEE